MGFKDWLELQEISTCTGSVAVFARPMLPIVRRLSPVDFLAGVDDFLGGLLHADEPERKTKKKKKSSKKKSKKKDD